MNCSARRRDDQNALPFPPKSICAWAALQLTGLIACLIATTSVCAVNPNSAPSAPPGSDEQLYIKLKPALKVKMSALKPGNTVQGNLMQDVYSGERQILRAGSPIRLTVDKMQRRRRVPNDHWPWVVKFFTPRHELYPIFQTAIGMRPTGADVPLRVSLLSIGPERQIRMLGEKSRTNAGVSSQEGQDHKSSEQPLSASAPTITLEGTELNPGPRLTPVTGETAVTLPTGTQAEIILLDAVSASKSRVGDIVQARLVEPVWLDNKIVLPEGSLFQARVIRRVPPRMLSRAGILQLEFTGLTEPGGPVNSISASVTGVQAERRSHMKIDPEGRISGEHPGKAWMLINGATTAGIAKEVDDGTQLILEAIISTATDASTAGTARIAATCASGIFMLTRHGRDVVLPKFTQLTIALDRPATVSLRPR
jgi:hypothetical protein